MVADTLLTPEQSVLGALLIQPELTGRAAMELRDEDFRAAPARLVWQTIRRLWAAGGAIDPVIVKDNLEGFDEAGRYIVDLMAAVPSVANLDYYIAATKKAAAADALREIGQQLAAAAGLEEQLPLVAKANGFAAQRKSRARMDAGEMFRSFAEDHAAAKEPEYIRWPFPKLNDKTFTEPGDLVVIAGRPSDGKTAFSLVAAWEQSKKYRVGYYSLETGAKKVRDRSMAAMAGIDMGRIKHNAITDAEWGQHAAASELVGRCAIQVVQAAGMSVDDIFADALANRYEIIYIDYLQLLRPSNPKEQNRVNIVTDISLRMHQCAQQTGICTVALSQLNRASAADGKKARRPQLTDLRESGQIEQDADAVVFIWREDQTAVDAPRNIFVAKNKEGTIGEFTMLLDGAHQRFVDAPGKMPQARTTKKPTPVIGRGFQELEGEDDSVPF